MYQYQVYSVHICAPEPHKIVETEWYDHAHDAWVEAEEMGIVNPRMRKREKQPTLAMVGKGQVKFPRELMMAMGLISALSPDSPYLTDRPFGM